VALRRNIRDAFAACACVHDVVRCDIRLNLLRILGLWEQGQHLNRSHIDMYVEVIAAAVAPAQSGGKMREDVTRTVARALRSAAAACQGVQRVATGWSINKVCATATGSGISTAGSVVDQPGWLDVPVVAAGLLVWARTHQEVTLQR
jgi:site-specific recombinase